jgi:hypothetical protein
MALEVGGDRHGGCMVKRGAEINLRPKITFRSGKPNLENGQYEWSKNLASENVTGDRYPFILCNNAANMSGYQRMAMLADNFPSDDYLNHSKVIFNTDEGMCQLAHVFPSEAVEVEGDEFIVQVRDVCRRSDNCSYS